MTDQIKSAYSLRYENMSPEQFAATLVKTDTAIEQLRTRLDLAFIERYIKGPEVLDFPIGPGRLYPHLLARYTVHGYDISAAFVQRARHLHPEIAERFEVQSMEGLTNERRFDTVLSFRVLMHIKHPEVAIDNVFRIVKPGGRWIVTHPNGRGNVVQQLEAGGFKVIHIERQDSFPFVKRLGPFWRGVWRWVPPVAARGLLPFWLYRQLDRLTPAEGDHVFVAERPQ